MNKREARIRKQYFRAEKASDRTRKIIEIDDKLGDLIRGFAGNEAKIHFNSIDEVEAFLNDLNAEYSTARVVYLDGVRKSIRDAVKASAKDHGYR